MGLCQSLVCAWETKRVTNAFCPGSLYPPVPRYAQECWRSKLPDGSLSGESSLAGRTNSCCHEFHQGSDVPDFNGLVQFDFGFCELNDRFVKGDSYHDLVWYHDTTAVEASLNVFYHSVHLKLS